MAESESVQTDAERIIEAARDLFDNRLGRSDGRAPYAPRDFWADLGAALYGEDDPRVVELRGVEALRFSRVRVCRQVEEGLHEVHAEVPVQPKPNQRFAVPSLVYVVSDFQGTALEAKALAEEIAWNLADGASPDEYSSGHSAAS